MVPLYLVGHPARICGTPAKVRRGWRDTCWPISRLSVTKGITRKLEILLQFHSTFRLVKHATQLFCFPQFRLASFFYPSVSELTLILSQLLASTAARHIQLFCTHICLDQRERNHPYPPPHALFSLFHNRIPPDFASKLTPRPASQTTHF